MLLRLGWFFFATVTDVFVVDAVVLAIYHTVPMVPNFLWSLLLLLCCGYAGVVFGVIVVIDVIVVVVVFVFCFFFLFAIVDIFFFFFFI